VTPGWVARWARQNVVWTLTIADTDGHVWLSHTALATGAPEPPLDVGRLHSLGWATIPGLPWDKRSDGTWALAVFPQSLAAETAMRHRLGLAVA
jgi:hypothetical protein